MNILEQKISNLLQSTAQDLTLSIANIKVNNSSKAIVVQVFLEKDSDIGSDNNVVNSVTVDDCANFSRRAALILDVNDIINSKYTLEVSSLGINRPLFNIEDYKRFVGKSAQIKTRMPIMLPHEDALMGRKSFKGKILQVANNDVSLLIEDNNEVTLDFSNIEKGNLDLLEPLPTNTRRKNGKK